MKSDLYQRITDHIVADREQGVRSWLKPWNAGHMAETGGRVEQKMETAAGWQVTYCELSAKHDKYTGTFS
jgi:antirestriction protein ArdC